jgi:hypothetical protein
MIEIVRCISCDGFGWSEDDDGQAEDCGWCGGIGYVYREGGRDRRIPPAELAALSERLEQLETDRMREIGYTGQAKKPWEQAIREGKFPKPPDGL